MVRTLAPGFAVLSAAALAIALSPAPAMAQGTDLTGVEDLDDRIDDITEDVEDEIAEGDDPDRFTILGVPQGLRGSAALQFTSDNGNSETVDLNIAGRITYGVGPWSHTFGVAAEYGESEGSTDDEEFFAVYEGLRAFTDRFYAFGTGRFEYDDFSFIERDAFIGGGLGYRVIAEEDVTWRLQAGPGARYTDDAFGEDEWEAAGIVSSRFFYGLTDSISLTNDTDVLGSDVNTEVANSFGVNFRVNDTLSTRVSYRTDYETDPAPGFKSTDNTFGVALVVGF